MKLEINKEQSCKNHKYMEIKQPTSEQPMEQRRNQKENFKYLCIYLKMVIKPSHINTNNISENNSFSKNSLFSKKSDTFIFL